MGFFLKRYFYAVSARPFLLLLFLVPPVLYLLLSAIIPDRFYVEQKISLPKEARVLTGKRPGSTLPLTRVVASPDIFFSDGFALMLIEKSIPMEKFRESGDTSAVTLKDLVSQTMTLKMKGKKRIVVAYYGTNRSLGENLVSFYAKRLADKLVAGGAGIRTGRGKKQSPAVLMGTPVVKATRALWRSERLLPSLIIGLVSLVVILLIIALLEWWDPAFKSERQVARYLGLPIIGSLPNLEKVLQAITRDSSPPQPPFRY